MKLGKNLHFIGQTRQRTSLMVKKSHDQKLIKSGHFNRIIRGKSSVLNSFGHNMGSGDRRGQ